MSLLKNYPFTKSRDVGDAMADALAAYIQSNVLYSYPASRVPRPLVAVYSNWAEFQNRAMSAGGALPAAAVLPDEVKYDDSSLSPRMLEDTWVNDGQNGFALFGVAEAVCPFVVVCRAKSLPQRKAIMSAFEDAFVQTGSPDQDPTAADLPMRYGKLLTMPAYYNRTARFQLLRARPINNAKLIQQNRWLVEFDLEANALHVVLRKVPVMSIKIQILDPVSGLQYNR